MMPSHKTKLKSVGITEKTIQIWDKKSSDALKECFHCTDWDLFIETSESLEELNDAVSEYILFCEKMFIKTKTVKCFGNNKPWVNKELKTILNEKKKAYRSGDETKKKEIQKVLKKRIRDEKAKFKSQMEDKFRTNDTKSAWSNMKSLAGINSQATKMKIEKGAETDYANELNSFYARFDTEDFSGEIKQLSEQLSTMDAAPLTIMQQHVVKSFKQLKTGKASGPDYISSRLLKTCAWELSVIFSHIYNKSLATGNIPRIWKTSKIVPIPKTRTAKEMNDFRPIALTSIVMKCLERIISNLLHTECNHLDQNQFAYKAKRSVEDAILVYTNNVYKHLDTPKSYVRTLFVDFSSAFNTIQPHILIPKLLSMNVNVTIISWILKYLTERPQFVSIQNDNNTYESGEIITSTGAPQGTVLAPFLFSIYTNDCTSEFENIIVLKYADDTAIQALIGNSTDVTNYLATISKFSDWCDHNQLHLNVKKTKELIFDFRKTNEEHEAVVIKTEKVERVKKYKYLGVTIDEKLEWTEHTNTVVNKLKTRLYFLRKLYNVNVDKVILSLFFKSMILSVLNYCLTAWGGNTKNCEKKKINRILKSGYQLSSNPFWTYFDQLFLDACNDKLNRILRDETHPLYGQIEFSARSGRIRHIATKRARHCNSFLPTAVRNYSFSSIGT